MTKKGLLDENKDAYAALLLDEDMSPQEREARVARLLELQVLKNWGLEESTINNFRSLVDLLTLDEFMELTVITIYAGNKVGRAIPCLGQIRVGDNTKTYVQVGDQSGVPSTRFRVGGLDEVTVGVIEDDISNLRVGKAEDPYPAFVIVETI